jgi:type VI secretion system protein ImpK
MNQPLNTPSLFDDGQIGTGLSTPIVHSKIQTINLVDLLHDGFYIIFLLRNKYIPDQPAQFREKILDLLNRFEQQSKNCCFLQTIFMMQNMLFVLCLMKP